MAWRALLQVMKMLSNWVVVMSAQLCKCGKKPPNPTLNMSECKVCKLYLNKAVFREWCLQAWGFRGSLAPLSTCIPVHCTAPDNFAVGNPSDSACSELDSYLISLRFTFFIWTADSIGCFLTITGVPRI